MDTSRMIGDREVGLWNRLRRTTHMDFRRLLTMPLFYIMMGISFLMPILILVMTTSMDGSVSVDPNTGVERVMEGFDNTWQAIGSLSSQASTMDMSLTAMCNINLIFFLGAVWVCLFISGEFKSGYVKNLFTLRPKKGDYVLSKMLVGLVTCSSMLLAYFFGALIGGKIAGLSFDTGLAGPQGILLSMLGKMLLMSAFVAIYTLMSVIGKSRTWLSMLLSLGVGMLLFNIIPMVTPLDSTIMTVSLCLAGGLLFSFGLGPISLLVLNRSSLV